MQPLTMAALGLGTGIMIGVAAGSMVRTALTPAPRTEPTAVPDGDDGEDSDALLAANANLVSSLQECNRRLGDLGQKHVAAPVPQPTATSSNR
ncbi:MAG TPA: hypothetical protein VK550_14610, partial [Polyangiaceae bacterium]|nr:hypothetical protein [Polyangiaceae bacterium]